MIESVINDEREHIPQKQKRLESQMVADAFMLLTAKDDRGIPHYNGREANEMYCAFVSQYKVDHLQKFIEEQKNLKNYYLQREQDFLAAVENWSDDVKVNHNTTHGGRPHIGDYLKLK